MAARLRVGILLDTISVPAWAFTALERIARSSYAEFGLIILNQSSLKGGPAWRERQVDPYFWLYRVFDVIDQKLFLREPKALTRVNASNVLSNVPVLDVKPVGEMEEQRFSPSDVDQIKSYKLDVLVKMGFGNLYGDILFAANYGVWAYRWGDVSATQDESAGFWEVVEGRPETRVVLQQLGPQDKQNKVLFESWFFTYPYSPARSRNYVLWSAASFLPRQLERLYRFGGEAYFQERKNAEAEQPSQPKSTAVPSNLKALWIMIKLGARNLLEIYRRVFLREQWNLLFDFGPDREKDISTFKRIQPPNDRFWADPHVICKAPNYFVFIEEYLFETKRGHISVLEIDQKGNYKQPVPVLQKDYHLSFPFVFDWMGTYYMIPESSENSTIDLYECVEFPDQWRLKTTLMQGIHAVDSTVFYRQGKWWLFTAISEQEGAAPHVELFLFYSDELFTAQWSPHPLNPIVSDVKKARGAGSLFLRDGRLYRPSQDCSKAYGYGFDLNEIVTLSETEYCERTVRSVRPDSMKGILATHTYANQADLTVVDALTRRPKWAKLA